MYVSWCMFVAFPGNLIDESKISLAKGTAVCAGVFFFWINELFALKFIFCVKTAFV